MTSSAPAKIILCGEHAVVYGQPALAVPFATLTATVSASPGMAGSGLVIIAHDINQVIQLTPTERNGLAYAAQVVLRELDQPVPDMALEIRSTIPIGGGLGSGAAVTAALMRELAAHYNHVFTAEQLNALVYEVETVYHGTPSGIDNTVIVYERPVYFVRGTAPIPFAIKTALTLLIADSGLPGSTREAVADVRRQFEADPGRVQPLLNQIGALVDDARQRLESRDTNLSELGQRLNDNHAILCELGVSSPELERLVTAARTAGALGAKLSGGGRGGNAIALVTPATASAVTAALQQAGAAHVWQTELVPAGN
jgi:mevalonate kinase